MTDQNGEARPPLERLREGDTEALAQLFCEHRPRLRRIVEFRLDDKLKGRISPSDVLQEAYIDALERLPHFVADPDAPPFLWLRWITMQRLVDVHRRHLWAKGRAVSREVRLDPAAAVSAASTLRMAELMADQTSPSQAAARYETCELLRRVLDDLEPADREVLALRHFEELGNRETAAVLGIAPAAASKRYVRALERLRGALVDQPGVDWGTA